MRLNNFKNNRGASAIITVVVVAAAGLIVALSAGYLGLGNLDNAYVYEQGQDADDFIDTCAEEALEQLRRDSDYTGATLSLGGKSCIINISGALPTKNINIVGSVGDYAGELNIEVDLSGDNLSINSWQEF